VIHSSSTNGSKRPAYHSCVLGRNGGLGSCLHHTRPRFGRTRGSYAGQGRPSARFDPPSCAPVQPVRAGSARCLASVRHGIRPTQIFDFRLTVTPATTDIRSHASCGISWATASPVGCTTEGDWVDAGRRCTDHDDRTKRGWDRGWRRVRIGLERARLPWRGAVGVVQGGASQPYCMPRLWNDQPAQSQTVRMVQTSPGPSHVRREPKRTKPRKLA
jgi:hypothetical protein